MIASVIALVLMVPSADAKFPEGEWIVFSSHSGGEVIAEGEEAARTHLFVKGLTFRSEMDGKPIIRMTLKFDTSKSPYQFDATTRDSRGRMSVRKGIYKIEGETWTYCFGPPRGDRPDRFDSRAMPGAFLVVAKKGK